MAELTIRLVSNPRTGKRDIHVDYHGEDDALPMEHERDHRALVAQLVGEGVLDPDEAGEVRVRRGEPARAGAGAPPLDQATRDKLEQSE